ncbi:hypothetical protein PF002_g6700 [Phytophthora fragariae]|uniref:Uncharacterized protein n=1 Tax=Phytophthora fragariae TaxID=53985 RepID=A0A6A3SJ81_9STRA|nr:hypothetical protein PF003_g19357 [Phytophthora fragariae]KAE8943896.1 hypothetical protein PF009_g6391 [Phytophthora fragariae]KAE9014661.1 hypothetical protein PF011_g7954 [Phytophthora fragariae]KAE9117949.1 hypothetical protein PF007_g9101 [Phytophthora fragariae]KAE9147023.1 hypothetical protein PF006_g8264 [Phytophthora fragariae]
MQRVFAGAETLQECLGQAATRRDMAGGSKKRAELTARDPSCMERVSD